MLLAGDAIGHTQSGNNNAYCQDNEISWLDWSPEKVDHDLLAFAQRVVAVRKDHPVFRRRNFFQGRQIRGAGVKDIAWLRPDGEEMTDEEWTNDFARCLGVSLSGRAADEVDERGQPVHDDNFLLLMNAHHEEIPFVVPEAPSGSGWFAILDTSCQTTRNPDAYYAAASKYPLQARSLALLVEREPDRLRKTDRRRASAA